MRLTQLLVAAPLAGRIMGKMLLNRVVDLENRDQVPQDLSIAKRDIIPWGGYPLLVPSGNTCPNNTTRCGREGCCPNATFCSSNVCCPKEDENCSDIVERVYACADTSWTLWYYFSMFCCKADEVGTHANLDDRCLPTNIPVPSSIIVSSVQQQTKTRPATPANTGSGPQPTSPSGGGGDSGTGSGSGSTSDPSGASGSDSGTGSGTGAGTGTGTGSNTGSSSGSSSDSNNNGLSTPATITIAVLATALGLALVFLFWFLWYRSHKKKQIKAAAAASGGTPELPASHAGVFSVPASYPTTVAASGTGASTGTGMVPIAATTASQQQQMTQTLSIPVQSTPSPGPSLDPPIGPPAYVPPHSHSQELHGQGVAPGSPHGYVIQNQTFAAPNGEQELDGITRAGAGSMNNAAYPHPGGDFGGQEDCSPSPGEVGGPGYGR